MSSRTTLGRQLGQAVWSSLVALGALLAASTSLAGPIVAGQLVTAPIVAALLAAAVSPPSVEATERRTIRVLTDRTANHLQPLFAEYERRTGVRVVATFVDQGLLVRLKSRPREADLVVSKNAYILELAKGERLLARFSSPTILERVPAALRDPDQHYTALSYRARVLFYSKERVKPAELSTYLALADPRWRGRICVRSGFHDYNVSLFSQLAAVHGEQRTREFLKGLHRNLARPPKGNDRAQVRAVMEGRCDVAIANSYYMGIMLAREEQRAWAEATRVFFPDQGETGSLVIRSGAALTTSRRNVRDATTLLEFLTDDYAQTYFAQALCAYPVKAGIPLAKVNQSLGAAQGVERGVFKQNIVPLTEVAKRRASTIQALAEIDFDG